MRIVAVAVEYTCEDSQEGPFTSMSCESETAKELRQSGRRFTVQRLKVAAALRHSGGHRTAEEIHDLVSQVEPHASIPLSTVYRTLGTLKEPTWRSGTFQTMSNGNKSIFHEGEAGLGESLWRGVPIANLPFAGYHLYTAAQDGRWNELVRAGAGIAVAYTRLGKGANAYMEAKLANIELPSVVPPSPLNLLWPRSKANNPANQVYDVGSFGRTPANVRALYDVDADVHTHGPTGHVTVVPVRRVRS